MTVFVPFAAAGDRARVRVTERRRRFARAEIVELLDAGEGRTKPRCAFFGNCGGCSWQHVDYAEQVEAKRGILREALGRIGGVVLQDPPPFTPSPSAYGYRMRARLFWTGSGLGYRQRASHSACLIDECPVLVPELEGELARAEGRRGDIARDGEEWELCAGSDGRTRSASLDAGPEGNGPPGPIELQLGGDWLSISVGTFVQANRLLHAELGRAVSKWVGEGSQLLELYGGAGFFTLALSRHFSKVEVVESSPTAVKDLRSNLERAGIGNVRVLAESIEAALPDHLETEPDVIFLDPPRMGLPPGASSALAALRPDRIVYLSCDPATLSRDVAQLQALGYAFNDVRGFDLFPHTPHVEALVCLTRAET